MFNIKQKNHEQTLCLKKMLWADPRYGRFDTWEMRLMAHFYDPVPLIGPRCTRRAAGYVGKIMSNNNQSKPSRPRKSNHFGSVFKGWEGEEGKMLQKKNLICIENGKKYSFLFGFLCLEYSPESGRRSNWFLRRGDINKLFRLKQPPIHIWEL